MPEIQVTRQDPGDIPLGIELYERAYSQEMSLSQLLERIDPSEQYRNDPDLKNTDAFQRQMMLAGIRAWSDPAQGIWASKVEDFFTSQRKGAAALLPEFISRVWRSAAYGQFGVPVSGLDQRQNRFYLSSSPVSDIMYPPFLQTVARQKQIQPAVPLATIVAITTPIDSAVYKAFYLTDSADERTMRRVAEGDEVPTAKLTGGDHSINVKKYGRRLMGTYETFRRMRIDRFAIHIGLLSVQAEVDKVNTGIDVLINGDGNASTAASSHNLTTLDPLAVVGTPTLKGYLNWRMQWANPYNANIILAQTGDVLKLLLLDTGTGNVMFFQAAGFFGIGGLAPINPQLAGLQIGWLSVVTANTWLGLDNRFGLEMVVEIGASLTETNKIISSQWNEIVMTESLGFAVFDQLACRIINLNA